MTFRRKRLRLQQIPITISGEHTSVKAVNEGEGATSYALFCGEIYNSKPEIRGAVTVSDGATLEVQAADTRAVCATRLDFGADQDYIVRTGDTLDGTTHIAEFRLPLLVKLNL